jgi:hypothetical protein
MILPSSGIHLKRIDLQWPTGLEDIQNQRRFYLSAFRVGLPQCHSQVMTATKPAVSAALANFSVDYKLFSPKLLSSSTDIFITIFVQPPPLLPMVDALPLVVVQLSVLLTMVCRSSPPFRHYPL